MFQNRNKTDRNVTLLLEKGREVFSDELIRLGNRGPINELNRYVCLSSIINVVVLKIYPLPLSIGIKYDVY